MRAALEKLGDRYAALGLRAAARGVYERALAADGASATAAWRLAELCIAAGDGKAARRYAEEAARRAPGPQTRLLIARALVEVGELAAARFALSAMLEGIGDPRLRAEANLRRADVAGREGDAAGAIAQILAAVDELAGAPHLVGGPVAESAHLCDEIATMAVALGRGGDVAARLDELAVRLPSSGPLALLRAALLAAEQANGKSVADSEIEAALGRAMAAEPDAPGLRLRLALRLSRRRYRDAQARTRAVQILESLAVDLARAAGADASADLDAERARVCFLLAGLYEDTPETHAKAEEAYRTGLRMRPRSAAAANNLALLALGQGVAPVAKRELQRALRLDPEYDIAWRNAARLLEATHSAPSFPSDVGGWLDAAAPGAGASAEVAARLARATAESATESILEAQYAKGHRLKNLLGIAGARVRALRKAIDNREVGVGLRLDELERDLGALYDEWAAHLRSLQAEGPRIEIVPVNSLVAEVVAAANQEGRPPIRFAPGAALPDLRGDRALLREALLNLVVNALDAQESAGEKERPVEVSTHAVVGAGAAPAVEIEIRDAGGGIPGADIGRIFAPGFTTKARGSGVGLSVANRVVVAHHGRILVDSEVGRGTNITVVLPSDLGGFSQLALTSVSRAEP